MDRNTSVPDEHGEAATAWTHMAAAMHDTAAREGAALENDGGHGFETLGRPLLWRTFRGTSFVRDAVAVERDELAHQWRVIPKYDRLFQALLTILEGFDVVQSTGTRVVPPDPVRTGRLDAELARLDAAKRTWLAAYPDLATNLELLETCIAHLPGVLDGSVAATDVLFPEGSLHLVEGVYRGNRNSDYYNRLLACGIAATVADLTERRPKSEKIRILEIGAGTGGSSAFVLEALKPWSDRLVYWYTDISVKFLNHARTHFQPHYPFVEPQLFDVARAPDAGEIPPGTCDLAFATNVLHATPHIGRTLRHLAAMMTPGGIAMINEPTHIQHFGTLTFGLLDGWWLFEDGERRIPHSPLLDRDAWTRSLRENGFAEVACFGRGERSAVASLQHVITARYDGVPRPSAEPREAPTRVKTYGPFKPMNADLIQAQRAGAKLSDRKREYLAAFTEHYRGKNPTSRANAQKFRARYADQRAIAFFHPTLKELCFPLELDEAEGAALRDVDGNEYLDIAMDFGCNLFGHRAPFLVEAMRGRIANGLALGMRPPSAARAAELLCELTGHERAVFTQSGTEAVMTAVRLARHATGRHQIVIFANSYHGHADGVLAYGMIEDGRLLTKPISPAIPPGMVRDVVVLDYNTPASLAWIDRHRDSLAAVLVEPMQSRGLHQHPGPFLRELRRLTEAADVALIFDEMITGFRTHPGGAQAWFGVRADLCTYGKVLGGGIGQGAIGGRARYLDGIDGGTWRYGDDSFPAVERTFFAGTHSQNTLGMAAVEAVLSHLRQAGPELQHALNRTCAEMARRLNAFFIAEEVPMMVQYFASLFRFEPNGPLSPIDQSLFVYTLRDKGIMISEIGNNFLSTAHRPEDIDRLVAVVAEAVSDLRLGGFLPRRKPARAPILPEPPYRTDTAPKTGSPKWGALLAELDIP
ncbi:Aminotransferase class III-fold pyridoxal phosphate-dependent enzyme [Sulfidibacter corallicola]|uniref:Aminotransferase class III-fold pyridoxal phosphate-dependent enzyme n=1 Tax=Sulfidibacter corallicola TaxID=2818388 RepID=A0A8A4TM24_SULCO|nr:aminotransferase class III-fold pyridoxal phosphate-dependent enzyme [Sulfidibacter corallicola]QTD50517.1 aminotransferase class III-fold pyridoxal phosphate-dependent enzyme [Sulfidibacter corallicola]